MGASPKRIVSQSDGHRGRFGASLGTHQTFCIRSLGAYFTRETQSLRLSSPAFLFTLIISIESSNGKRELCHAEPRQEASTDRECD